MEFWVLILIKMLQLLGDVVPHTPYQGSALDPIVKIFRQFQPTPHPGLHRTASPNKQIVLGIDVG